MRSLCPNLRRLASAVMLAAMAAFVQQSSMIVASEAAASFGVPQPATMLNASVHFHDNLAVNLHVHASHNGPGHVHGPTDVDHDKPDGGGKVVVCSGGAHIRGDA